MNERPCDTCEKKRDCWVEGGYRTCEKLQEWNKKATADIEW